VIHYQGDKMDSILKKQEEVHSKAQKINQNLVEVRKETNYIWILYFLGGFVFLGVFLILIIKSKMENQTE
jgi:hypoxanthine-guanine phosphoribosyltransferase